MWTSVSSSSPLYVGQTGRLACAEGGGGGAGGTGSHCMKDLRINHSTLGQAIHIKNLNIILAIMFFSAFQKSLDLVQGA